MANERFLISRDSLAKFLPDNDTIRRFEKLFQAVLVTDPTNFDLIFRLIEELSIEIGSADSRAIAAIDALNSLRDDLDQVIGAPLPDSSRVEFVERLVQIINEHLGTVDAKANNAISLVHALSRSLEVDISRPAFVMPRSFPVDYIDWDQNPAVFAQTARMEWNNADDTLNLHHSDGVTQQMGQELYGRILNNTGSTIPNGSCLGINPATNSYVLFTANGTLSPITIVGVSTQDIPNGANGRITVWGRVHDLDTSGTPFGQVWIAGQILYVSPTVAGGFTNVKPTAPNLSMPIAQVLTVNATTGIIAVRPTIEQQLFYGQFIKTTDQVPSAANTAQALLWDSAPIANGVSIGAPASRIVAANAGLYKFSVSLQLTSGSASVKNVWIWFRKNGVDVTNSSLITSLDSGTAIRTPSRSLFFSLAAGDYIEIFFASDSTNMTVDSIAATAFAPAAPAAILTVNQEQQ
jgi:hypothetical protein